MALGGNIKQCYNLSDIIVTVIEKDCRRVGGICSGGASIEECYNMGNITLTANSGVKNCMASGIASTPVKISSCYNRGTIKMISKNQEDIHPVSGGIMAQYESGAQMLENCYNTGNTIIETSNETGKELRRGSIVGYLNNPIQNATPKCYWLEGTAKKGVGEVVTDSTDTTISKDRDGLKQLTEEELGNAFTSDKIRN